MERRGSDSFWAPPSFGRARVCIKFCSRRRALPVRTCPFKGWKSFSNESCLSPVGRQSKLDKSTVFPIYILAVAKSVSNNAHSGIPARWCSYQSLNKTHVPSESRESVSAQVAKCCDSVSCQECNLMGNSAYLLCETDPNRARRPGRGARSPYQQVSYTHCDTFGFARTFGVSSAGDGQHRHHGRVVPW